MINLQPMTGWFLFVKLAKTKETSGWPNIYLKTERCQSLSGLPPNLIISMGIPQTVSGALEYSNYSKTTTKTCSILK